MFSSTTSRHHLLIRSCTRRISRLRGPSATAAASLGAVRYLNVHEYVAMELFEKYDIPVPRNKVATSPEEAETAFLQHINTRKFYVYSSSLCAV